MTEVKTQFNNDIWKVEAFWEKSPGWPGDVSGTGNSPEEAVDDLFKNCIEDDLPSDVGEAFWHCCDVERLSHNEKSNHLYHWLHGNVKWEHQS